MSMPLDAWQQRLEGHYAAVAATRSALGQPLFALEHGLAPDECEDIFTQLRRRPYHGYLLQHHTLLWVVYATEYGYAYAGDDYWPSFEKNVPGWEPNVHRSQLKSCFKRFAQKYAGVVPTGRWANWFSIIAWPITHAILPKYLQLQFARVLHAARYDLASVVNLTPAAAGRLLASHAYGVSRRFEEFLEQEELAGRILLALLADNPSSSHSPIHLPTLQRVVRDLERERLAREYLNETRQYISARIKGAGRGHEPAPRDYTRNPVAPGQISIRPSLMLRRSGPSEWTPFLDFPSLAEIAKLDPAVRHFLRTTRCKVSGADDTWLPAGWLSSAGQRRVLRTWPPENKPLLTFETDRQPIPRFLSNLLESECRLNAGAIWACRTRTDGLAEETVGRIVRSGQEYILLSRKSLPASDSLLSPCVVHCDGLFSTHLRMPSGISAEQETFLRQLGLQPSKAIQIWPAGAPGRGWDGEGQSEWLTNEAPCFGIVHDHPVDAFILQLNQDPEKRIPSKGVGKPVFVRLSPLPAGTFRLAVTARRGQTAPCETKGHIVLRVREPAPWTAGTTLHTGVAVILDPPDATLDTLWEGQISLTVLGPEERQVDCRVDLERPDGSEILSDRIGTYRLPVRPRDIAAGIRSIQERHGWDLLEASSARIRISGEELGQYVVRLNRDLKPVRWICRHGKGLPSVRIIDDTGSGEEPRAAFLPFLDPVTPVAVPMAQAMAGFEVSGQGGLFSVRSGAHLDALIINHVTGGLQDLKTSPAPRAIHPGAKTARAMLEAMALWSRARLAGNLVTIQRAHTVRCLQAWMIEALCGRNWALAESQFALSSASGEAVDVLKLHVLSNSFAAALKFGGDIDTSYEGRKRFAEIAARYGVCKDSNECDFALVWALEPLRLLVICRDLDEMLDRASGNPVLLRGARLLALLNGPDSGDSP